jgi:hypothetical protein
MKKINRLEDSFRNAELTKSILLSRHSFHKSVLTFRNKWNIPEDGLSKAEFDNWHIWFIKNKSSYKPTPEDIVCEKERHKRIDKNSTELLKGFDKLIDKYLDTSDLDAERVFKNDIGEILRQQALNPRWYRYLERYLLLNEESKVPSGMEFSTEVDEVSGQEILILKITEEIRKADLLAVLPTLKDYQKKLSYFKHTKTQPKPKFHRNKKVAEMKEAGDTMDDIIDYLDKHYPLKNGGAYIREDVLKMISEYNKSL